MPIDQSFFWHIPKSFDFLSPLLDRTDLKNLKLRALQCRMNTAVDSVSAKFLEKERRISDR